MTDSPETIADICIEMRAQTDCLADDPGYNHIHCRRAAEWARRIDAAADHWSAMMLNRIDELTDECDRLRSALLTICTSGKTAEGLREIAMDACSGKENEVNYEAH